MLKIQLLGIIFASSGVCGRKCWKSSFWSSFSLVLASVAGIAENPASEAYFRLFWRLWLKMLKIQLLGIIFASSGACGRKCWKSSFWESFPGALQESLKIEEEQVTVAENTFTNWIRTMPETGGTQWVHAHTRDTSGARKRAKRAPRAKRSRCRWDNCGAHSFTHSLNWSHSFICTHQVRSLTYVLTHSIAQALKKMQRHTHTCSALPVHLLRQVFQAPQNYDNLRCFEQLLRKIRFQYFQKHRKIRYFRALRRPKHCILRCFFEDN